MRDDQNKHETESSKVLKNDPKRDRLKQALRENLKRRKSQAKARSDIAPAFSDQEEGVYRDQGIIKR
jgi:hypothetical protein